MADIPPMSETQYKADVGRRLRAAFNALGITQTEVGRQIPGTPPPKIGNWLRGSHYPPPWFVKQFCERYGITTDWLYRGIVTGMDARVADALWKSEQDLALAAQSNSKPAPKRRSKDLDKTRPAPPRPAEPDKPRPTRGGNVAKNRGEANGDGRSARPRRDG